MGGRARHGFAPSPPLPLSPLAPTPHLSYTLNTPHTPHRSPHAPLSSPHLHGPLNTPRSAAPLPTIFLAFLRLGCTAFGGPAMIPYIHDLAVIRRRWLSEDLFRLGMAMCQAIPGATAMQAAAYVGLRTRGLPGAIAAYTGFGLPAFILIVTLTAIYASLRDAAPVLAAFQGLQLVVVALIGHAAMEFCRKYVTGVRDSLIALGVGLTMGLGGNPILALVAACAAGLALYRDQPGGVPMPPGNARAPWPRLMALCLPLALTALALLALAPHLAELAWVMFKVDLFAFGGGYVSLPLMLHEVVNARAWMPQGTFMDGIALGQVTPGPIVITSAYVGYLLHGLVGAAVATIFAFSPSLVVMTAVTPYFDRLQASPLFQRAVRASLASLAGLMAAVFARFAVDAPFSALGVLICIAAFVALRRGVDVLWVVLAGAGTAMLGGLL